MSDSSSIDSNYINNLISRVSELKQEVLDGVELQPLTGIQRDLVVGVLDLLEYGLVAYLYTEDVRRGLSLSEKLEFGMIGLNRGLVSDPAAPFGGVKQSGLGREGGKEGMLEFQETQYISTEW